MKKIYPKEWLELHPYKQTDSVDQYYVSIANKIYADFYISGISEALEKDENVRYTSLCLAAWFEDVISQIGIWQTFTAECKKRYGAWLPFYPIHDDYFPDEINLEDIRFLLWHHMQYLRQEQSVISPESPEIEQTAQRIYNLLADEYETAPENEKMQEYLHHTPMVEGDFFRYREVLEWFHYHCYFNIENIDQYLDESEKLANNRDVSPENLDIIIYATHMSLMLKGRRNLLSLTSPEWLALIGKNHPECELQTHVRVQENSCYLLEKEDEEHLYLKDLCNEKNEIFKVFKKSLDLSSIRQREVGRSTLICELVHYGSAWWQCGILIENKFDDKIAAYVDDLKKEKEEVNEKAAFHDFMKASDGKFFVFCQSQEEVADFIMNKMGYKNEKGMELPRINAEKGVLLTASPYNGLSIQAQLCECIKSPDNPYYNQEKAEKNAIMFIVNPEVIPYAESCMLQDLGMLPDACLSGSQDNEYRKEFIQKNAHFLTDYFHHQCREKDLQNEEWQRRYKQNVAKNTLS